MSTFLKNRRFTVCVDLGCGEGSAGETLKPHCEQLIGVDHNLGRLSVAKEFGGYTETVYSDVRNYQVPSHAAAVFIFDLIEHLPKTDGQKLLSRLSNVPYVMLTTPTKYFSIAKNGHAPSGVWTNKELETNGFQVTQYSEGLLDVFYGTKLLAVKAIGQALAAPERHFQI